jgi:HK97 gp10 family phage protein
MSIELEGFEEVMAALGSLADTGKLEAALGKACAIVEADAKKKAPKDNGDLRRSIASKVEGEKGIVYTPLLYAPYVEYGTGLFAENGGRQDEWTYQDDEGNWHTTSGMHPQPYMRPSLNENREKIVRVLKEGITSD